MEAGFKKQHFFIFFTSLFEECFKLLSQSLQLLQSLYCLVSFCAENVFQILELEKTNWQIEIFSFRINSSSSRMSHSLKSNNVFSTSLCLQITDFASSSSFNSFPASNTFK